MHKKIVSTCSPNNNTGMYWVCIQYIVKKFPDRLFLVHVTPYVPIRDNIHDIIKSQNSSEMWE